MYSTITPAGRTIIIEELIPSCEMGSRTQVAMEQNFQNLSVYEADDQIIIALDFGTTVSGGELAHSSCDDPADSCILPS